MVLRWKKVIQVNNRPYLWLFKLQDLQCGTKSLLVQVCDDIEECLYFGHDKLVEKFLSSDGINLQHANELIQEGENKIYFSLRIDLIKHLVWTIGWKIFKQQLLKYFYINVKFLITLFNTTGIYFSRDTFNNSYRSIVWWNYHNTSNFCYWTYESLFCFGYNIIAFLKAVIILLKFKNCALSIYCFACSMSGRGR